MTTREHFEQIRQWLEQNRLKFKGMTATFQVELSGDDGGTFWLQVNRGQFDWGEGPAENPGCTVAVSAADFKLLASGQMSPAAAFMTGKVRISGDITLAMRFGSLLA